MSQNGRISNSKLESVHHLEETLDALRQKYKLIDSKIFSNENSDSFKPQLDKILPQTSITSNLNREQKPSTNWKDTMEETIAYEKENFKHKTVQLRQKNQKTEQEIFKLKNENKILNEELEKELERNKTAISESIEIAENLKIEEQETKMLAKQYSELCCDLTKMEKLDDEKKRQLEYLQSAVFNSNSNNEKMKLRKVEIQTSLNYEKESNFSLQKELENSKKRFEDLNLKSSEKKERLEEVVSEISFLKEQITAENELARKLNNENSKMQREKNQINGFIAEQINEEESLEKDIGNLKRKIITLEAENEEIIRQLTRVNKMN